MHHQSRFPLQVYLLRLRRICQSFPLQSGLGSQRASTTYMDVTEDDGERTCFMNTQGFALCWDVAPLQGSRVFSYFISIKTNTDYAIEVYIKKNVNTFQYLRFSSVRMKGLEPPRREAPDPKSGAAANYATSAAFIKLDCKDIFLNHITRIFFEVLTIFHPNSSILLILCFS
jgi:hypothetical protein